jgi:glycosyltransferase involved in cell wall biosynthesis
MNTQNPRISVIIPTYNRSALLVNAIESVLAQTYHDYELVVIDDGSTDNTADAVAAYGQAVRYFYNTNAGASAAQNRGIEVARGEWVAILASDDTWSPAKLELQAQTLEAYASVSDACVTDCSLIGTPEPAITAFGAAGFSSDDEMGLFDNVMPLILGRHAALYVQSMMIKRTLIRDLGGFDRHMKVAEDTDLFFRMSFKTRICYVNQALVQVDRRPEVSDRLSRTFVADRDLSFRNRAYVLRKWLSLADVKEDKMLRELLLEDLRATYYQHLGLHLRNLRLVSALGITHDLRRINETNAMMLKGVINRALRRHISREADQR